MLESPDPGLSVTLDAVDEIRLRRLAVRMDLTPDQLAARLIAERLAAVAEQALAEDTPPRWTQ